MKKRFTILIAAIAAIMMMALPVTVKGQTIANPYTITLSSSLKINNTNTGTSSGNVTWYGDDYGGATIGTYQSGYTGQQFGTGKTQGSVEISTSSFGTSTITSIVVSCQTGTSGGGTVNVTVGSSDYGTQNMKVATAGTGSAPGDLTFPSSGTGSGSGTITITMTQTVKKALYLNSITVNYSSGYSVTYTPGTGNTAANVVDNNISGSYTVRYNNGQNGNPNFSKTGHTFKCWNNGTNDVNEGANITVSGNVTLAAQWNPIEYTITYKPGFETSQPDVEDTKYYGVDYEIADNVFDAPSDAHTFTGWKDGNNNDWAVGASYTANAPLTLTAQWTTATMYTVTYNCNGGESGCPSNTSVESGTQITLPAAPTYTDHTFDGWLDNAATPVKHDAGSSYTVTGNVTFTAQWLENLANPTFTVTGVSNGTANTYYVTANIEIEQEDGAYVYYTTDGSDPTDESTEYTEAFSVTNSCTIKAIAIFEGYADSEIVSQEIIIDQPNEATFTNGVYSESFNSSLGLWYAYSVFGNYKWGQGTPATNYTGANINGYSENADNEDWLISPKMTVLNGKLDVNFKTAARYSGAAMVVKYSTDYNGYGNPNNFTWTNLAPSLSTNTGNSFSGWTDGKATISGLSENANVYVAFKYTSAYHSAKQYVIKDFSAKQCYPITYYANYENPTGTTADANSPYAVGTEVTILDCGFDAPDNTQEFTRWNTQSNGSGTTKNPGQTIEMTTAGFVLYAILGEKCTVAATMNATTGAAAYNYNGGNKRFDINLSSSVKTLGGCEIYDYGFVYSTTVNPTVGAANCTKVQVGDSQPTVDDPFVTTIEGADLGETYYVRSYATNNAGTAYSDVINVEVPANFDNYRYEISYTTNGTAEASTYVYQGAPISGLATPTEANIPSGYTFMGWRVGEYPLSNTVPNDYVKNGDAISSDLELKAVFAISSVTGEGTVELTNTTIKDNRTGKTSYGNYSIGDWSGKFMINKNGEVYSLQLGYNTSSSNSAYNSHLTTPECDYNITSITISTNNNTASGRTFYLCSAYNLGTASSGTYGSGSTSAANGSVTISVSGNTKQFHIYPNGTAYIESISLSYSNVSYYNYCTTVTPLSGDLSEASTSSGNAYYISAAANVPADKTATINGALGNGTASNLVIHNGGQLVLADNNSLKATVEKTITAPTSWSNNNNTGWYAISSPVGNIAPSSVTNMTLALSNNIPQYDLYKYVENMGWYNAQAQNQSISTLENGNGYLYARKEGATLSFAGTVSTEGFSLNNLSQTTGIAHPGLHLIGNPYTHDIYLGTAITGTNLTTTGYYALNSDGLWISKAYTEPIKPMQAVFVFVTDATNIINFSNKPSATRAHHDYIRFTVANSQYEDVAYAMFDKGYGLNKIEHRNSEAPMLYIPQNDDNYAIAMMEDVTKMFNLSFKAATTGRYTLSFDTQGEYNYLHVIDRLTGEDVDMLLEGEYSFIGSPNDNENRFVVKLAYKPDYSEGNNEIFAFQSGSDILISGEGELQVFDVMGRFVMSERINGATSISADELSKGVYVLRIVGTEIKTQKIVVR